MTKATPPVMLREQNSPKAINLVKRILGEVPFATELYWLARHRDKTINSRFSLEQLKNWIPTLLAEASTLRTSANAGKNVFLFGSSHRWITHTAVVGFALYAQGHDVSLGYLPYHDWRFEFNPFDIKRQNIYAREVLKNTEPALKPVSFLGLHAGYKTLPEELQKQIEQVARFDAMYTEQNEEVDIASPIYRLRLKRNMEAARAAYSYFKSNRPDVVIVPNGSIQEYAVVYRVARFLGIQAVTYEFGDQRERIWLAQNGEVMRQETDALWKAFSEVPLAEAELKSVQDLFEARRSASTWKNFSRLWQNMPAEGIEKARQALSLDKRPVVLLATNVLGDSLTLGREVFSHSMEEWLERTLQYFAGKNDVQLVIRVHPGEILTHGQSMVDVTQHVLPNLPENIHLIRPDEKINTYDLIAAADAGLVYTTTVGLEMALCGVPVVVAGSTHYRGRGFTHDPNSWVRYYKTLGSILANPRDNRLSKEQVDLAWAYAYRFFFDFPRPFPWHLIHFWKEMEEKSLVNVLSPEGIEKFGDTFKFLVGEPLDWAAIREKKYGKAYTISPG